MLDPVLYLLTEIGELCSKHRSVHGAEPNKNSREFDALIHLLYIVLQFKIAICVR